MAIVIPEVVRSAGAVQTRGLAAAFGGAELRTEVSDSDALEDAAALLRAAIVAIARDDRSIAEGDVFSRGFWSVRFHRRRDGLLDAWEPDPADLEERRGADFAVRAWREQQDCCERADAMFNPPRPDQLASVSAGVLEGLPTQGVRYPSPDHMSGWWITTSEYDGDAASLCTEHTHHVAAARPDLLGLLALDFGWRWNDEGDQREVRFDPEVAEAVP